MIEGFFRTSIIALDTKLVSVFQANPLTPYFVLNLWHMPYKNAIFLNFLYKRVRNDQV